MTRWLGACALALALVVGLLAAVVDDEGGGARPESWQADWSAATAAAWDPQPPPPLPAAAMAAGEVQLAEAAGRLLAVADGDGLRPLQVWVLDGGRWSGPETPPGPTRARATVVATASELVVWGGVVGAAVSNDGFAFDPVAQSWRLLADAPLPPRQGAVGLWTGSEVVVVGGHGGDGRTAAQAAAYDPAADAWRLLPNADGLPGATVMAAAWTGERAVLWVYDEAPVPQPRLLALDVAAEAWVRLDPPPFAPANAASGLAGDDTGGLVATTTEFGNVGAARLPEAAVAAPAPATTPSAADPGAAPDPGAPSGPPAGSSTDPGPGAAGTPGGGWQPLDPPPVPTGVRCPSDLLHGGAGTVLLSRCSGELFLLDGGAWRRLPPLPEAAAGPRAGTAALVTDDAVCYLAPPGTVAAGEETPAGPTLLRLPLG